MRTIKVSEAAEKSIQAFREGDNSCKHELSDALSIIGDAINGSEIGEAEATVCLGALSNYNRLINELADEHEE